MKRLPKPSRSLLDRLVAGAGEMSPEPVPPSSASQPSEIESVLRDLENLLNTRRPPLSTGPDSHHQELNSFLAYGTGDFSSSNPCSHVVRQKIRREIETLLQRYEPRLRTPIVRFVEGAEADRSLRFVVEAVLLTEPAAAAPITFSTRFDTNCGAYFVSR